MFISRGKVHVVHLRNCTAALPEFAESYVDDGILDVAKLTKLLVDEGYTGTVILDHTPAFAGDGGEKAATSFSLG
jgi:D-mannonate dehydratase